MNEAEIEVYRENGLMLRHYGAWRQKLCAGFLVAASVAGLGIEKATGDEAEPWTWAPFVLGMLILTPALQMAELRNRQIVREIENVGAELEEKTSLAFGYNSAMKNLKDHRGDYGPLLSHGTAVSVMFVSFAVLFVGLSLALLVRELGCWNNWASYVASIGGFAYCAFLLLLATRYR